MYSFTVNECEEKLNKHTKFSLDNTDKFFFFMSMGVKSGVAIISINIV